MPFANLGENDAPLIVGTIHLVGQSLPIPEPSAAVLVAILSITILFGKFGVERFRITPEDSLAQCTSAHGG